MQGDRDNTVGPNGWQGPLATVAGLLAAAACLLASPAAAQTIRGVVLEADTRSPIVGATIEILGPPDRAPIRATSDTLGLFTVKLPRAGRYTIQARRLGFHSGGADTIEVGPSESISVEIQLGTRAVPLDPVRVTVRGDQWLADFERRRLAGFGRYLDRRDIEARSPMQTTDLFRITPGVVMRAQRRGPGSMLLMRGTSGLCAPAIWIDGLYVAQTAGTSIDDLLSPQSIEAIEVYNSVAAAPAQYRAGICGVLLFWTRRGSGEEGGRFNWKKVAAGVGAVALFIFLMR